MFLDYRSRPESVPLEAVGLRHPAGSPIFNRHDASSGFVCLSLTPISPPGSEEHPFISQTSQSNQLLQIIHHHVLLKFQQSSTTPYFVPTLFLALSFSCSVVVSPLDGISNITCPAVTQITGRHCSLSQFYCTIALCLLRFTIFSFIAFGLLVVNSVFSLSVIFILRATMLINLNLSLAISPLTLLQALAVIQWRASCFNSTQTTLHATHSSIIEVTESVTSLFWQTALRPLLVTWYTDVKRFHVFACFNKMRFSVRQNKSSRYFHNVRPSVCLGRACNARYILTRT